MIIKLYSYYEQLNKTTRRLVSCFCICFRIFLQDPFPSNPDLLYLVIFIHSNLTTTVTLAFLFGSKVSHFLTIL